MVVAHRPHSFRFVIYTADHEPAHVHITHSGKVKVNLTDTGNGQAPISVVDIKRSDMRWPMEVVTEHREKFLKELERVHGRSDRGGLQESGDP